MQKLISWITHNKLRLVLGSIFVLLEIIVFVWPLGLGYYYKKMLVLICAGTWLAIMVRIPEKCKPWLGALVAILAPGVLTVWLERMAEKLVVVSDTAFFYNVVIAYLIEIILLLLTLSFRAGVIGTTSLLTLVYTINYFVYVFRGKAFTVNDILAWKTAARVAGNYDFTPNNIMVVAWSFFFLFVILVAKTGKKRVRQTGVKTLTAPGSRNRLILRGVCILVGILLFWGGQKVLVGEKFWEERGITIDNGFSGLFYCDGFLVSSCIELSRDQIVEPEGYTPEAAQAFLNEYVQENSTDDLPHIIMIMNESFTDLRVWGDIELSGECLPFYNSLEENTVRGYVNASVLGGGTANSEFEVLTGCSMGLLPTYYYPYQQCVSEGTQSMVSVLKEEGYSAYSIHPEARVNWNRENVYEYLGFDASFWREDFTDAEIIHAGVSDADTYKKIIELYEARESGEKIFVYDVTMQNHAGYTHLELEKTISAPQLDYHDLDMYLNLLLTSDQAFEELVHYFEQQDEKVIVCMFGDHQPKFDVTKSYDIVCAQTEGLTEADKLMNLYKTPFVIWANYDIEEESGLDISMNYLGALVMKQSGVNSYPYFNYLNALSKEWPIITVNGICDSERRYYSWEEEQDAFDEYRTLQYHQLFSNSDEK